MSFADVSALLSRVAELAAQALQALRHVSDSAEDCGKLITESTAGTTNEYEASAITADFEAVRAGALLQCKALEAALQGVEQIRARFEVGATPAAEPTWAEQRRRHLPSYITSGFYLDPDGYTELVQSGSEPDGEHKRINDHLVEVEAIPPRQVETSKHVEMKVAWRMRHSGIDRVDLVINEELCTGRFSCTVLLPDVLLPGQTLVIHDPVKSHEICGRDDS
ncbi:DddA-like double-stranded DNA deaminase toxin [Lentzea cavernae]|uniref:SCP1.201-like deaminase n=1 Tax=Lentzea cavernae TaxID=2020703 RepID=A0ABQ3MSJ2_9PSEU|nr:DddA-like double-stranded DNA deaminase toxin [Lentzea cavernae]GHH55939.1 hypothetical protein GCM10017774_73150 [Lentzea cavernae]